MHGFLSHGGLVHKESNARIFLDERDLWPRDGKFVTTNIIVRTDYLKDNPEIIKRLINAQIDETLWINDTLKSLRHNASKLAVKFGNETNTDLDNKGVGAFINAFNDGLKRITGNTVPEDELRDALKRLEFTYDPIEHSLFKMADDAYDLKLVGRGIRPNLTNSYDLGLLKELKEGTFLWKIHEWTVVYLK